MEKGLDVTTIIELVSATDTITFHPAPDVNGWVYDNATLDAWYALPDVEAPTNKRPNAHGVYGLGQVFAGAATPVLIGQRFDVSAASALVARDRLSAMFQDGNSITMRVTDELTVTTRVVQLVDYDAPFKWGFDYFSFDLSFVAPDPRRYGPGSQTVGTLPTVGTGLIWDLGTAGSGLYFDWGVAGDLGQLTFTNTGATTTYPRITVSSLAGSFDVGFRITEIETGRELTYENATLTGDVIVFDSRTKRATLSGSDVTRFLSSRDWFEIPAGQTRRYQIASLGSSTGAPTMTLYAAPAYM